LLSIHFLNFPFKWRILLLSRFFSLSLEFFIFTVMCLFMNICALTLKLVELPECDSY
jgi:hypothetical protein